MQVGRKIGIKLGLLLICRINERFAGAFKVYQCQPSDGILISLTVYAFNGNGQKWLMMMAVCSIFAQTFSQPHPENYNKNDFQFGLG